MLLFDCKLFSAIKKEKEKKKHCFSVWKMKWTALRSHRARFTGTTVDKWTESRRNPRYSFGLRGTDRLSAQAGAAGCYRSRDTVIHSAGRYSEESSRIRGRINNISVKSCEKHSNSVKAMDIRTNASDEETRKNSSINTNLHHSPWI